ncbi:MAG: hypothetical protein C0522_09700 [Rhodocyclaceae bacterium]|nr:hypothetical protein [Rhodocyclaceae bacterium]
MRLALHTPDAWNALRHLLVHTLVTLLAVGFAFTLPELARYILYQWWPAVQDDSQLLLLTEIVFAGVLVLLFNALTLTLEYRRKARINTLAALVHAREHRGWLSRLAGRSLVRDVPWKRDVMVMAVTGYDTFTAQDAELRRLLEACYEIRVMLMNPYSDGARSHAASRGNPEETLADYRNELETSIDFLARLHASGKKVSLKLYSEAPFWKLVFTGEHAWVRYCHDNHGAQVFPEYVFALQPDKPMRGFFPAFYTYFLNQWNDQRHPEYNFESNELIYRNKGGQEIRREPFPSRQLPLALAADVAPDGAMGIPG